MSSWTDFVSDQNPVKVTPAGTAIVTYDEPPKYADMSAYSESKYQAAKALGVDPKKVIVVDVMLNYDEPYLRITDIEFGVK